MMPKTFVYTCKPGENEELRYSIRSVYAFYPEAIVWVIGGKPSWYRGNYINVQQDRDRFQNVRNSLIAATANDLIPEDFIVMNDDFFFLKRLDEIPTFASGLLIDKIQEHKKHIGYSSYIKRLEELDRHCKRYVREPLDFDIHVPMPVNKNNLVKILSDKVMWRSNYGNRFITDPTIIQDVKVYSNSQYSFKSYDYLNPKHPFISTDDKSFKSVYDLVLKDLLFNPSELELP